MKHLVVTSQFASFQIGDRITDQALVAQYAASHPAHVVAVMALEGDKASAEASEAPAPAPAAGSAPEAPAPAPVAEAAPADHEETEH